MITKTRYDYSNIDMITKMVSVDKAQAYKLAINSIKKHYSAVKVAESNNQIEIINDLMHQYYNDPAYLAAWERVQELAKKGRVAEKYAKEWSENAKDLS